MAKAVYVEEVQLSTGETLEVWRAPSGGVVGVDVTFIEQVDDVINDPYSDDRLEAPELLGE